MYSISIIFRNISESTEFLSCEKQFHVIKNMIFLLNLHDEEEYEALSVAGFKPELEFDYERACQILGKSYVDNWIEEGIVTDNCNPLCNKNLDYLNTPVKRKQFYNELPKELRRTGSISMRLHKNYTLMMIEQEIVEMNTVVDTLVSEIKI